MLLLFCDDALFCLPDAIMSRIYSSNQLIKLGQNIGLVNRPQLTPNVYHRIKSLNLLKHGSYVTHRGSRGGSRFQRWIKPLISVNRNSFVNVAVQDFDVINESNPNNLITIASSIPVVTSGSSHLPCHGGVNIANLRHVSCISNNPGYHRKFIIANVNPRSIKNKTAVFVDYIVTSKPDVCFITETWLSDKDDVARSEISPNGYIFKDHPRADRTGGGTGLLCRSVLGPRKVSGGETKSFEYSEYVVKLDNKKCRLHVIYRPTYSEKHPVTTSTFFEEFPDYLECAVTSVDPLIIAGDFNIHMDVPNDPDTKKFLSLLECMGLQNHVFIQTHEDGHALDLVITRKHCDFTCGVPVADCYISDHSFVKCSLSVTRPELEVKDVTYRKYRAIDLDVFKQDLSASELCTREFSDLDDLVSCYKDTLSGLIDKHAPQQSKRVVSRPCQPWFNDHLKQLKQDRRRHERKWLKSDSKVDLIDFKRAKNVYCNSLESARCQFYRDKIEECAGDQKKLFQLVAFLTGANKDSPLPDYEDPQLLANDFGQFFAAKIETIQAKIDNICDSEGISQIDIDSQAASPDVSLTEFHILTQDEVRELIVKSSSKHCKLDPAPTWLVKECLDLLLPVITLMINLSLRLGYFPDAWKCALVIPLIKKLGLDLIFKNFRPVSNLEFISKLVERAAVVQVNDYTGSNGLLPDVASSYRKGHSTETALIKVQSDMFDSMDKQNVTLLVMLDLSAAFDTVSHSVLFDTLESQFGVSGTVLGWFKSYLNNRKQRILIGNDILSNDFNLDCGVPQGSCLGPILFVLYISSLYDVISRHLPDVHGYADDHQLYISFKPGLDTQYISISAMEACITDVRSWMLINRLMINDSKTEVMLIGTRQQLEKVTVEGVKVGNVTITPVSCVKNLGVHQDQNLKMDKHVAVICSKSFYQLYKLRKIRRFLTPDATQTLVHAFITSNLDYCNALFYGMPQYLTDKLQRVQNAAARVVMLIPKFDHISGVMCDLHWLPVKYRIQFKILLLTFKCRFGLAPRYLQDMIFDYQPPRSTRSSNVTFLLKVPRTKRKTLGTRSFRYYAPKLWNKLPLELRASADVESFKSMLKTHLFRQAYDL